MPSPIAKSKLNFTLCAHENWESLRLWGCFKGATISWQFYSPTPVKFSDKFDLHASLDLLQVSADGNVTTSTLLFTPSIKDNGARLVCRASNLRIEGAFLEDVRKLNIFCKQNEDIFLKINPESQTFSCSAAHVILLNTCCFLLSHRRVTFRINSTIAIINLLSKSLQICRDWGSNWDLKWIPKTSRTEMMFTSNVK